MPSGGLGGHFQDEVGGVSDFVDGVAVGFILNDVGRYGHAQGDHQIGMGRLAGLVGFLAEIALAPNEHVPAAQGMTVVAARFRLLMADGLPIAIPISLLFSSASPLVIFSFPSFRPCALQCQRVAFCISFALQRSSGRDKRTRKHFVNVSYILVRYIDVSNPTAGRIIMWPRRTVAVSVSMAEISILMSSVVVFAITMG